MTTTRIDAARHGLGRATTTVRLAEEMDAASRAEDEAEVRAWGFSEAIIRAKREPTVRRRASLALGRGADPVTVGLALAAWLAFAEVGA